MSTQTPTEPTAPARTGRGWAITLWTLQGVLGLAFLAAGGMKLAQPVGELAARMPWVTDVPALLVRFVGLVEVLGAVGLLLPAATRVLPRLAPLAAAGLAVVMALAAAFHVARGEFPAVPVNVVPGGLLAVVAWGRWRNAPTGPRHRSPAVSG